MNNHHIQGSVSDFWSKSSPAFNTRASHIAHADAWRDVLAAAFQAQEPKDVVDLGTGTGACAIIAAGLGHRVRAYDGSEGMLRIAQDAAEQAGVEVTFLQGLIETSDIPSESADIVTLRNVLWTVENPRLVLQKAFTILRPGGILMLSDGHWSSSPGYRSTYAEDVTQQLPLHDGISESDARRLLEETGFSGFMSWQHLFPVPPYASEIPMFVMTARKA